MVLTSLLLAAMTAAAQVTATQEKADSGLCYTLRRYRVDPSEKLRASSGPPRSTTCTPASRFRVKFLPSTAEPRVPKQAECLECGDKPAAVEKRK